MRARFSSLVHTGPGVHPASYTMGTGFLPGVKRPGRGVDHPPPSSAEDEGRAELYILPLWAFVACSTVNFTVTDYISVHKSDAIRSRGSFVTREHDVPALLLPRQEQSQSCSYAHRRMNGGTSPLILHVGARGR